MLPEIEKIKKQILDTFKNVSEDYSMFHFLDGINRMVHPPHVANMRKSVKAMGVLRPVVIASLSFITDSVADYIIDAQHLFYVLKSLELPIPYIRIEAKSKRELIEKMAFLNNSSKPWQPKDYVTAWSVVEPDYLKLIRLRKEFGLPYYSITMLAINNSDRRRMKSIINRGDFKITNEHFPFLIKEVVRLLDIADARIIKRVPDRFVSAFLEHYNSVEVYDPKFAEKRVKKYKDIIVTVISDELENLLKTVVFGNHNNS